LEITIWSVLSLTSTKWYRGYEVAERHSLPGYYYMLFAHELTHAIQFGSEFAADCAQGRKLSKPYPRWVLESMAQAVGLQLGASKFPYYSNDALPGDFEYPGSVPSATNIAVRDYTKPLPTNPQKPGSWEKDVGYNTTPWFQDADYHTSTFFDHLTRHYGDLPALAKILEEKFDTTSDEPEGIQWLHRALKKRIEGAPSGLYHVYPQFVTEFASYGGYYKRFNDKPHYSRKEAREAWIRAAIGPCAEIELDGSGKASDDVPLTIDRIAARCIRVRWRNFPRRARLDVQAEAKGLDDVDALHLGLVYETDSPGSESPANERSCFQVAQRDPNKCLVKTFVKAVSDADRHVKEWVMSTVIGEDGFSGPDGELYLAIANVRPESPEKTKKIEGLKVRVGFCRVKAESKQEFYCPKMLKLGAMGADYLLQGQPKMIYGIAPHKLMMPGLQGLELEEPGGSDIRTGSDATGYVVATDPLKPTTFGFTGPLRGQIGRSRRSDEALVSSATCGDPEAPIGEVVRSDDSVLRIKIATNLCELGPRTMEACASSDGCPVVDRLVAEIVMPFGRRYFAETAGRDVVTPGMERYVDMITRSIAVGPGGLIPDLSGLMGGGGSEGGEGSGGAGRGSVGGAGGVAGEVQTGCDCSCEALVERQAECKTIDENDWAAAIECASCISECLQEMLDCGL